MNVDFSVQTTIAGFTRPGWLAADWLAAYKLLVGPKLTAFKFLPFPSNFAHEKCTMNTSIIRTKARKKENHRPLRTVAMLRRRVHANTFALVP